MPQTSELIQEDKEKNSKDSEVIEVLDGDYVVRTPGTGNGKLFEPIETNPFPLGSIICLDVSRPKSKETTSKGQPPDHEATVPTLQVEAKRETIDFEVTHVYWPPTLCTVYRVRKVNQSEKKAGDEALGQNEEYVLKVYDPRLCQERALTKNNFGVDLILNWRQENEEKARRFLESEECPTFTPSGGFFGLLMATHKDLHDIARKHCKMENCKHEVCKPNREPEAPSYLVTKLGRAVKDEATLQLVCEQLYRKECAAYDRIRFGSNSQSTIIPRLHYKGRVKTSPERIYAPRAILLEYIDGVSLNTFFDDDSQRWKNLRNVIMPEEHKEDDQDSGTPEHVIIESKDQLGKIFRDKYRTVYGTCKSIDEKKEKKREIEKSLRMLAEAISQWPELGVVHEDLYPRNIIYVDNPKPGQGHFRVIDFNFCTIAPLSTTILADEPSLTQSPWTQEVVRKNRSYWRYEMDGFEPCDADDSLPRARFSEHQLTNGAWDRACFQILNLRTWSLINIITRVPFLLKEYNKAKVRRCMYSGILADYYPPFWDSNRYVNSGDPLVHIKDIHDELRRIEV